MVCLMSVFSISIAIKGQITGSFVQCFAQWLKWDLTHMRKSTFLLLSE